MITSYVCLKRWILIEVFGINKNVQFLTDFSLMSNTDSNEFIGTFFSLAQYWEDRSASRYCNEIKKKPRKIIFLIVFPNLWLVRFQWVLSNGQCLKKVKMITSNVCLKRWILIEICGINKKMFSFSQILFLLLYFDLWPGQTCHSKVMHRKEVTHYNGQ